MVTILDVEASGGFEPPIRVLQTPALPLGYDAGRLVDWDFSTRPLTRVHQDSYRTATGVLDRAERER
jgi:hypothetical protein